MDATELQRENERLKQMLAQHAATIKQFEETLDAKQRQVESLEHQVKLLLIRIKGSRQERIDPNQLLLFSLEELQQIAEQLEQGHPESDLIDDSPRHKRKKRSGGRIGLLPSHLPREVQRHELTEEERACPCCGETRQEMGVESSEQLELIPAQVKVIRHERVKYACRTCEENIAIADKPPQPIEKGLPAPGLCAHTVLSKFGDHQPLYRQEDIHSRLGMTIRRSTLCGWLAKLADLAKPLVQRMKALILESKVIHTDDTSIKMLTPGQGQSTTAKFWPYLGDWEHPYAVYDFTITRERDGPQRFLQGYRGYLQADAYSGYDCIYASAQVTEVACWIHARRYWHQARDNDPKRANTALGYIARLSQIEKQLRQAFPVNNDQGRRDFESVARGRYEHARPVLDEFKQWLDREQNDSRILPKSPIRAAMTYTQNQWDALQRYVEQGYLSFDNNLAERLVKVAAIGRKNYLFVGSSKGGERAAIMYSLVSSAKANRVEPFAWLTDLFRQLPNYRESNAFASVKKGEPVQSAELDHLLPDLWLQANPAHRWDIDEIRRQERQKKND